MTHNYIRDDRAVLYTQFVQFTRGTKYGSTYLSPPILTAQSLDNCVRNV